jgi:group II intron reverse transcriptase/maturase
MLADGAPTLRHVFDRHNLERAWQEVRAKASAAGVDDVSVQRWERNWRENLDRLSHLVRTNRYRPNKIRRFFIPKRTGGVREIAILTVTDRVLQRAVHNVLEPAFERLFLAGSFGYRPGRSVADAVERVLALRAAGHPWVFDADIEDCFPSLAHGLILEVVGAVVQHRPVLGLIAHWLRAGAHDPKAGRGIVLGAVISPLLCNVLLHRLDAALEAAGHPWVRYADDFVVLGKTRAEVEQARTLTAATLAGLQLRLHPGKTAITTFAQGLDFLGVTFSADGYRYLHEGNPIIQRGNRLSGLWAQPPDGYQDW